MTFTKYFKNQARTVSSLLALIVLCANPLFAGSLFAQDSLSEIEIDRDAGELSDLLTGGAHPKPDVAALLDTAMVVTNVSPTDTVARCYANNRNGTIVGRIRVRIPAGGLRFFLASDIIEERGFVGSVVCSLPGFAVGTELLLGVITTDIQVHQDYRSNITTLLFPVTAMR